MKLVEKKILDNPQLRSIVVVGDGMLPMIADNEVLLVDPDMESTLDRSIVVAEGRDGLFLGRLHWENGRRYLRHLNFEFRHEDFELDGYWKLMPVVGRFQFLFGEE